MLRYQRRFLFFPFFAVTLLSLVHWRTEWAVGSRKTNAPHETVSTSHGVIENRNRCYGNYATKS